MVQRIYSRFKLYLKKGIFHFVIRNIYIYIYIYIIFDHPHTQVVGLLSLLQLGSCFFNFFILFLPKFVLLPSTKIFVRLQILMMLMSCSNVYRVRVLGIRWFFNFPFQCSTLCVVPLFRVFWWGGGGCFLDVFGFIVSDTFDAVIKISCDFFPDDSIVLYPLSSYYSIYV